MLLYLSDATSLVAEPLSRIIAAQLLDEVGCVPRDAARELHRVYAFEDLVVDLHGVGARERRRTSEQLEHEYTWKRLFET